ncbi:hypothetical protein HDU67_005704, partial [Dinochytrium kinnereticum]
IVDIGQENYHLSIGGPTDFYLYDFQKASDLEKLDRSKFQDGRLETPVKTLSFANGYIMCFE